VHASAHYDVDRIFVGLSWELHYRIVHSSDGGQRGDKRAHNSTTKAFLHNYYTFVSPHDSDHEGVVRIFAALSCELWGYILLYYITSGNRTPGSRSYPGLLDTLADSICIHQLVLKALGCSYNCRWLAYDSFQLTHVSCDDTLLNWSSNGDQNEERTLLQRSQRCHNGEFRHVSISTRQRSLWCGQNLRGPFLRATLLMRVGSCARAMADKGETKGLITPPSRWVSAHIIIRLCHCMIAITRM